MVLASAMLCLARRGASSSNSCTLSIRSRVTTGKPRLAGIVTDTSCPSWYHKCAFVKTCGLLTFVSACQASECSSMAFYVRDTDTASEGWLDASGECRAITLLGGQASFTCAWSH